MASRRLALLLAKSWTPSVCRTHHRTLATFLSRGYALRATEVCRIPPTTCSLYSTKAIDSSDEVVEEPPGLLTRFWRWLNSDDSEIEYHMSEEERRERDELMIKVQEMYFSKPPVNPGLDFFKEVIEVLIKYDDKLGVETLWNLMSEMNVKPDEELEHIVLPFLKQKREEES